MFFKVYNDGLPNELFKARLKKYARKTVLFYELGATELKLNDYCIKTYHKLLTTICLELLNNIKIYFTADNYAIIKFSTKYLDNLAQIITYGNGIVQGSFILRDAFLRG